jgi:hypothetical protein
VTWKLVEDQPKIFLATKQKRFEFLGMLALLPPYTSVLHAEDQTEAGFVQRYDKTATGVC